MVRKTSICDNYEVLKAIGGTNTVKPQHQPEKNNAPQQRL